ncbi:MAG: phenylalanine--tRNA ligase subunit alpha, partial [Nanoarchaeota archaeon]|nr:phenylalanine--tRNA ligase subunit alpha [Nanoarchaeota archaeon]
DQVRQKFIGLGFCEMTGPIVESEFWNMDALFMPQFHSARDIHDAYYVKEPASMKLDPKLVKNIKESHEKGFGTGSKGWEYDFDVKRTHNTLLRTQGTACSARMLASPELKIPGKYFGITRCFRYDVIDATHNCDFYQTEGIVIEEGLDFGHLKGLLKMFAEEFAETDQIRIRPAYFPFTEPSAELFAKHPDLGWIELGGAGIFRPELVKPLTGKDVSVLAWGLGIDRLGMFKLGIKDIRQLFSHDLGFMRNVRVI